MTFEKWIEANNITPENTPNSDYVLLQESYNEGYKTAKEEIKEYAQNALANENSKQVDLYRSLGLKLVGWDYENNKIDEGCKGLKEFADFVRENYERVGKDKC